jgi:antitoxin component HigA of HigAB toxin-antitoxin module
MSNPVSFINTYTQNIVQFCQLMQTLRGNNDQLTQDPSLITRYFDTSNPSNPNISVVRADITAQDVTDAQAALVQMLFTYDSGAPPQKAKLFKMLP